MGGGLLGRFPDRRSGLALSDASSSNPFVTCRAIDQCAFPTFDPRDAPQGDRRYAADQVADDLEAACLDVVWGTSTPRGAARSLRIDDAELTHDLRGNIPLKPTAELHERSADVARRYADGPVLVTSFNEWYEDTAIEPSEDHGEAYLDVTAEALAAAERKSSTIDGETFVLSFGKLVAESEMNPDIENGRQFSFMLDKLTIRDDAGQARIDLDVGTGSETVEFLLGSYGPENAEDNAWRWLGGQRDTVIAVPSLPDGGEIEISGLAPAKMDVALEVDRDVHDKTTLAEGSGSYWLDLG